MGGDIRTLKLGKKIFGLGLFSGTLVIAWLARKQRLKKMKEVLKDSVRIPVSDELFNCKVSFYRYKGFVFPDQIIMSGVFQKLPDFQFREDDIMVASFPKTGTTWVQEIVYMLTHNCEESTDSSEVLETRFPYLEYPYPGIKDLSNRRGQRLIKTHLPATLLPQSFTSSGAKMIYVMRNPRDTAVSYFHFVKLLTTVNFVGSFKQFIQLFISDKVAYGPFYDHIRSYLDNETSNILVLRYEDLKDNPIEEIKRISEFLQIPLTDFEALKVAKATTFRSMSQNKSVNYEHWKEIGFANRDQGNFLRKGEVGDWKNYFSQEMLQSFEAWEKMNDRNNAMKFRYEN